MSHPLLRWTTLMGAGAMVVVVALVLAVTGFLGGGESAPPGAEEEIEGTATVVTATPTAGSLSPVARAYGTVASSPQHTFVIALMRDGVFKSVNVRDGESVHAGQALFTVTTAPANTAAYSQARSAVDFATRDLTRVQRMFDGKLATNDQLATARKTLADAQVQLEQQSKIGAGATEAVIKAPADGVITGLMATPGDKVQANVAIATLVSRSNMVVQINLEPEDASKLVPGAPVRLSSPFQGSDMIEGRLTSIGGIVDTTTHLVKGFVEVPADAAAHLTLGMTLVAQIDLPARQGILIPRTALLEDATGPYVFTVSEGEAHRQDIKVLVETDDMALIEGLDPALGSQVVVSGNSELEDDTKVQEATP